jgi:hypothetical protein
MYSPISISESHISRLIKNHPSNIAKRTLMFVKVYVVIIAKINNWFHIINDINKNVGG